MMSDTITIANILKRCKSVSRFEKRFSDGGKCLANRQFNWIFVKITKGLYYNQTIVNHFKIHKDTHEIVDFRDSLIDFMAEQPEVEQDKFMMRVFTGLGK